MLYQLHQVKKGYGDRLVVDIGALELERGQIIALQGPNGAGKTTLLEILALLQPPSAGEVRFLGQRVYPGPNSIGPIRRRVVLVQQQPIMFSTSLRKNLEFPLLVRQVPKKRRTAVVDELLELVGLRELADAPGHSLSGGEMQRAAIARALACGPEVILLDEPTSNVDAENRAVVERLIGAINRERGISVIFTSHDMLQAVRLAHRTLFLYEGRVARVPMENLFRARVEKDAGGKRVLTLQRAVQLPLQGPADGECRVYLDPGELRLAKGREEAAAGDARLQGRLLQLTAAGDRVRVLVDVGLPLTLILTREELSRVRPQVGESVAVLCPPEAIKIV